MSDGSSEVEDHMAAARKTPSASQRTLARNALKHGRNRSAQYFAARSARKGKGLAVAGGSSGLLIAEGDSWFDYPGDDVLGLLEDRYGYRIESVAHAGDTVESMAYDGGQLNGLARVFNNVRADGRVPRAILLSGGGNDVAGDEFAILLNHAQSGLPALNQRIVDGVLQDRLRFAIISMIGTLTGLSENLFGKSVPILLHGYARAVPDGRGVLGGFWLLPGPWLQPGFAAKGYPNLNSNVAVVGKLIDLFNALLASIAGSPGCEHVHYVDVRSQLSNVVVGDKYRESWANELHPTSAGFALVAAVFDQKIRALTSNNASAAKPPAAAIKTPRHSAGRPQRSRSGAKK